MATQDFIITKFGDLSQSDKFILQIPTECCGTHVNIYLCSMGISSINQGCCAHYHNYSYSDIWNMFGSTAIPIKPKSHKEQLLEALDEYDRKFGRTCSCGNHNEYAVANQPDGSYKCYNCRNI